MSAGPTQDIDALLRAGINAAKTGDRTRARELLMQVVEADERRPLAWLWLSGVVDGLEDRKVCLENVLALDPANQAARRGLEWVRGQEPVSGPPQADTNREPPARVDPQMPLLPARPPAPEAEPPPLPARSSSLVSERLPPQPASARPKSGPLWDDPPDVLLCPYCAALTQESDRQCPACKGSLWIKAWRRETHSLWLWNLMVLRAATAVFYAVSPLLALAIVAYLIWGEFEPFMLLPAYLGLAHDLDPALVQRALTMLPPVYAVPSILLAVYSALLLVGMYLRWRPVFFLLLAGALVRLGAAVLVAVLGKGYYTLLPIGSPRLPVLEDGYYVLLCGGTGIAAAIGSMLLLMLVYDDFCRDTMRVYFVLDQQHSGGVGRLEYARILGEQGMWALAVLYLRAGAARLSSQAAPFLRLAHAYIRLGRTDLARETLEEARRLDPGSPIVAELDALLKN